MSKRIDLNKTIYQLCQEYPELIDILDKLGFNEITKKAMRISVGKIMTLSKGSKMKNIPMSKIISSLEENGFELVSNDRVDQLKTYLKRLSNGDKLEDVKKDFAKEFSEVDSSEIMNAEQELLQEGMPLVEVQKLCDVHSALFHDEELIENTIDQNDIASKLKKIPGHPLYTFSKENEKLSLLLENEEYGQWMKDLAVHYAKKGDLLYPLLKTKYNISGPNDVMWTVDDEIRDEINKNNVEQVLSRIKEMIYKEQNILFPICAENFTEEEWYTIYQDSKDYDSCFGVKKEIWQEGEEAKISAQTYSNDEVVLPSGHLTIKQLTWLLNTIPLEISFVDASNINRYFNEGEKVFKRPSMAIDREVFSCHPPKIEPMVRKIIDDFRNNRKNEVNVLMNKKGRTMLVKYMAVKDEKKNYLGTVELVQDMEFAKEHFLNKD